MWRLLKILPVKAFAAIYANDVLGVAVGQQRPQNYPINLLLNPKPSVNKKIISLITIVYYD